MITCVSHQPTVRGNVATYYSMCIDVARVQTPYTQYILPGISIYYIYILNLITN